MVDPISGTVEKSNGGNVIKETFEVTPEGMQTVRNDIPVGVGGAPVDRIPANPRMIAKLNSGENSAKFGSTDRCIRLVNVPLKGGTEGVFHCSRACVSLGTDGARLCPEHDKEAFKPSQSHPPRPGRTFNSASISLTDAEKTVTYEKEGKRYTVPLEEGRDVGAARAEGEKVYSTPPTINVKTPRKKPAIPATPRVRSAPGTVQIKLTLDDMAGTEFIDVLCSKIVEAINGLPARTVAEMEGILKVREKVKQHLGQGEGQ